MQTWVEVDVAALEQNIRQLQQRIGDMPLWAVVKSNAYGHDLALATEAFWRGGASGWMVTQAEDAEWLSQQRYFLPILIVLPIEEHYFEIASQQKWQLGIASLNYLREIQTFSAEQKKRIDVHLEIETGMHRTGLLPQTIEHSMGELEQEESLVQVTGLFTHLHSPENEKVSQAQLQIVRELQFDLGRKGIAVPPTHILASNGLGLYGSDNLFDGVRLGKALYGFCPYFPETEQALIWKTRLIALGEAKPGDTVGYEGTYKVTKPIRTATLPVGYADGLDRRLSNKGFVLVGGKRCPIIGRISMNETTIDISGLFKAELGQEVVLLGQQENDQIRIEEIAEWGHLSEYEFLVGINPTLKRIKPSRQDSTNDVK